MKTVYVVTNLESGWDCVRDVYIRKDDAIEYCAEREDKTPEEWEKDQDRSRFVIHTKTLHE